MATRFHELQELELALMRHGIDDLAASSEHCGSCHRVPLVGEHIHVYKKQVLCDLCRERETQPPVSSRLVHGPAFGNSIRIIDQRIAA